MQNTYFWVMQQTEDTNLPLSFWEFSAPFRASLPTSPIATDTHTVEVNGLGIDTAYISFSELQKLVPINEKGQIIEDKVNNMSVVDSIKSIPTTAKVSDGSTHPVQKFNDAYYKLITVSPKSRPDADGQELYLWDKPYLTVNTTMQYWNNCITYQFCPHQTAPTSILVFETRFKHGTVKYMVQASRAVQGDPLEEYYLTNFNNFADITIENFGAVYFTGLLLAKGDGKLDNHIATKIKKDTITVTDIDSDQSGQFPFAPSPFKSDHLLLQENNILFLLPQAKTSVADSFRQEFLNHSPAWYTLHMLKDMLKFSDAARACYPALQREYSGMPYYQDDFPPLLASSLPPQLDSNTGETVAKTLHTIQQLLKDKPEITYDELLKQIKPLTYYTYQQASLKWFTLNWLIELAQDKISPISLVQLKNKDSVLAEKITELLPELNQLIAEKNQRSEELTHTYLYNRLAGRNLLAIIQNLQSTLVTLSKEMGEKINFDASAIYREYFHPSPFQLSIQELLGPELLANPPIKIALQQAQQATLNYKKAQQEHNLEAFENPNAASITEVIDQYLQKLNLYEILHHERPALAALLKKFHQQHGIPLPNGFRLIHLALWAGDLTQATRLLNDKKVRAELTTKENFLWDVAIKSKQVEILNRLLAHLASEKNSTAPSGVSSKHFFSQPLPIPKSTNKDTKKHYRAYPSLKPPATLAMR